MMVKISIARGAFIETRRPIAIGLQEAADAFGGTRGAAVVPGLTPLMHAARGSHLKCVTLLLQAGANAKAEDEDCMTPLHFAAQSGDFDICVALLKAGSVSRVRDDNGLDAFQHLPEEVVRCPMEWTRFNKLLREKEASQDRL